MTYFVSDIHGEYDLFLKLLDKIGFSDGDILYVLGDMIDKGKQSVKLVDYIRRKPNIKAIVGNHEFDFLKYYYRLMKSLQDGDDANAVLSKLQAYFPNGEDRLSWEAMDYLESLPLYIETADFICVHAGVETDEIGMILPMRNQKAEVKAYSRNFKEESFRLSGDNKTVFFGHTPCSCENDDGAFIKTPKPGVINPQKSADYLKIRLDCGVYLTQRFGALRLEDMREFYVEK